jgi:hypothetical protein
MNLIEKAKATLRDAGYFVDNLWHIDDVHSKYTCDAETAQDILNNALTNDATMEQIWTAINIGIEIEKEQQDQDGN